MPKSTTAQDYIFVLGLPKTGTKLIRNVLSKSSRGIYISPETHFLGHLLRPGVRHQLNRLCEGEQGDTAAAIVDLFYGDRLKGTYWRLLRKGRLGVDRTDLLQRVRDSGQSDREIFEILMQVPARAAGKAILGEKTPAHLYHLPVLLEWFPDAKVIHTFRDPRAVLASEMRKRRKRAKKHAGLRGRAAVWALPVVLTAKTIVSWLYAVKLHRRYTAAFPQNYMLSQFEELVEQPEPYLRRLCDFLGIEFERDMLMPRVVGSSFEEGGPTEVGFDQGAIARWREYLNPVSKSVVDLCCRTYYKEFGYV